ncbi:MAG: hypothetical protein R3F43_15775 [bacterium]
MDLSLETVAEHLRATGRFTLLDPAALEALVAQAEIRALAPGEVSPAGGGGGGRPVPHPGGQRAGVPGSARGAGGPARLHLGDHPGEQALLPGVGRGGATPAPARPSRRPSWRVRRETPAALADADGLAQRLASAGRARLLADLTAQSELFQALATEVDFAEAVEEVAVPPGGRLPCVRASRPTPCTDHQRHRGHLPARVVGREVQVGQAGVGECVGELGAGGQPAGPRLRRPRPVKALRLSGDWFTARYAGLTP